MRLVRSLLCSSCLLISTVFASAESLSEFNSHFWQWRAQEQPFTNDDIPRIDRPANFRVDWSAQVIAQRQRDLAAFEQRLAGLVPSKDAPIHEQVDYRLLGSALARVRWELMIQKNWQRDPQFYVDQTIGSVFVLLLQPAPFVETRQQALIARVKQIPVTIQAAQANLTDMRRPFAQLAITALEDVDERIDATEIALAPELSEANHKSLHEATSAAIKALQEYRAWLIEKLPSMRSETAIGRENYLYFLRNVALMDFTPEQLLSMSTQEWARSVAFEAYQQQRSGGGSAPVFPGAGEQVAAEKKDEEQVRVFLTAEKILTVPSWLKHYHNVLLPAYLVPFEDMGVTDDLTGPDRLNENGTSYIHKPSQDLGFFYRSTAQDPRPILVHEGVPGHYFQLCLGWHSEDPIRRHYYDSGANEGIGFYAEEMMQQAGYFDDNPHTRATIYSFMRLRALRVEVDVKLALGEYTLQQAADYLASTVPMDKHTALDEAAMFASTPGQAISYQVGKLQITELLSDARRSQGSDFSMLKFNDFVWNNGNVPIALQRWEMLGDASRVPAAMLAPAEN